MVFRYKPACYKITSSNPVVDSNKRFSARKSSSLRLARRRPRNAANRVSGLNQEKARQQPNKSSTAVSRPKSLGFEDCGRPAPLEPIRYPGNYRTRGHVGAKNNNSTPGTIPRNNNRTGPSSLG